MQWDKKLAEESAIFAAGIIKNNKLEHSTGPYGENLGMGWGGTPNCAASVMGWYGEYTKHDFSSNDYVSGSGHFTQVVWNSSIKVGVGVAHSKELNRWAVCARYTPAGNIAGKFLANVFPLRSGAVIPSSNDLKAAAANVTAFPPPPALPKSSGCALAFWGRGASLGVASIQLWLLRALPFATGLMGLLYHGY